MTYIENNPGERIKVIALEINRPAKTIERWIRKLRDDGKIEFRGSKKTGGYYSIATDWGRTKPTHWNKTFYAWKMANFRT